VNGETWIRKEKAAVIEAATVIVETTITPPPH
jgi:hypothetical protein